MPVLLDRALTPMSVFVYKDTQCQRVHVWPVQPVNTMNTPTAFAKPVHLTPILPHQRRFLALHVTIVDAIRFTLPCAQ